MMQTLKEFLPPSLREKRPEEFSEHERKLYQLYESAYQEYQERQKMSKKFKTIFSDPEFQRELRSRVRKPARPGFKHGLQLLIHKKRVPPELKPLRKFLMERQAYIMRDLGGEDQLSEVQKSLIEKAMYLETVTGAAFQYFVSHLAERKEKLWEVPGMVSVYRSMANAINQLRLIYQALGLEKKVARVIDLQDYIKEKTKQIKQKIETSENDKDTISKT